MTAAAQSAVIGYSQADLYPQFGLAGSIGVAGSTFTDQFSSGSVTGFISPFFSWNVFNYGRIKNNVRVQDSLFEQAVLAYQNSVLSAAQEVENNLQSFLRIKDQVGFLTTAVEASENAARIALVQYRQGAADYTRVLNTQSSLLQQQDQLAAARGQVVTSLIATYKAIGGGWQIREGKDYINPELKSQMKETIDWGGILEEPSGTTAVETPSG
jgi:outer membrane protein TolC